MKKFWYNEKVYSMKGKPSSSALFPRDTLYFRTTLNQFKTWRKLVKSLFKLQYSFDFKEDIQGLFCELSSYQAQKRNLHFRVYYRNLELYMDGHKIASGPVNKVLCAFQLIMHEL